MDRVALEEKFLLYVVDAVGCDHENSLLEIPLPVDFLDKHADHDPLLLVSIWGKIRAYLSLQTT